MNFHKKVRRFAPICNFCAPGDPYCHLKHGHPPDLSSKP